MSEPYTSGITATAARVFPSAAIGGAQVEVIAQITSTRVIAIAGIAIAPAISSAPGLPIVRSAPPPRPCRR